MRKIVKYILITILFAFISWMLFGVIMTFGHKSMPEVEVPKELKALEIILAKETNGGDSHFNPILEYKIERCHSNLELYLYIYKDSISQSKELINNYVKSVNKRVNIVLRDKKCIDSLIINTSVIRSDLDKINRYRYSFPIK